MTVEDAVQMMGVVERQSDGTGERAVIVADLMDKLLTDPETFYEYFFTSLDATRSNCSRELAEELLRDGLVDEHTTFADLPGILEPHKL